MNKFSKLFLLSALMIVLLCGMILAVEPFGATVNPVSPSDRAPADGAGNDPNAIAGNITDMDVSGFSITQSWQGYFGNVTGTIMLADSSDNVMYNWSVASPEGEIYASTNNSITWGTIKCLEAEYGTYFENLESMFGITYNDSDGVNETFSLTGTHESGEGLAHDLFYTNNIQFSAGDCVSTHLFSDTQSAEDGKFQEVLLYDSTTASVVFTSILDEETPEGFDGNAHDFQMLVLENGHLTNIAPTTYYFWVELE